MFLIYEPESTALLAGKWSPVVVVTRYATDTTFTRYIIMVANRIRSISRSALIMMSMSISLSALIMMSARSP